MLELGELRAANDAMAELHSDHHMLSYQMLWHVEARLYNCTFFFASALSTVMYAPLVLAIDTCCVLCSPDNVVILVCACVGQILEDRNPQKLSKLQSRLLFMSCQRRPAQREGCSGGMLTRMQQEVFHHSAIEGPLERYWLCHVSFFPFSVPL